MKYLSFTFNFPKIIIKLFLILYLLTYSWSALADRTAVDKVYHPYVLPNEQEFEWRYYSPENKSINKTTQRFAYGFSVLENVMLEGYVIAEQKGGDDYVIKAYELEARWMLTEQGEYWADWGILFEAEKLTKENNWEVSTALLAEKEFGKTSVTMNLFLLYEWGDTSESELKSQLRVKYRYRWIPQLQPAIELYSDEDFLGLGPAFMGIQRFDGQKQLKWEFGYIFGLGEDSSNHTFRISIEYEF